MHDHSLGRQRDSTVGTILWERVRLWVCERLLMCGWVCVRVRHKEGTISLRAKMRLGNWIEQFCQPPPNPNKRGCVIFAGGHMGCEAKLLVYDMGMWGVGIVCEPEKR